LAVITACHPGSPTLFTRLSENKTGVNFKNLLKEDDPKFSILSYPYYYNGGGVGIGDINNDGLPDILFTGNMVDNALFLNKGGFEFDDITQHAGIAAKKGWCTGVAMVDRNIHCTFITPTSTAMGRWTRSSPTLLETNQFHWLSGMR
jgi:hypothetical protein